MAHVTGQSRYQSTLFPEVLDEVVSDEDPVRVIDAFVDTLDLTALGFSKVEAEGMGRPPYAPGYILKLAIVWVCRSFIRFCREQSLFGAELLAIDGTKIAAVASRKQVMTPQRIAKLGVDAYFPKPFSPAKVRRKLEQILDGKTTTQ